MLPKKGETLNKCLCKNCGHQLIRFVEVKSGGSVMEKPDTVGEIAREIHDKKRKGDYHYAHASGSKECLAKGRCVCKKPEPPAGQKR